MTKVSYLQTRINPVDEIVERLLQRPGQIVIKNLLVTYKSFL
jgi:hypothetical protein